MASLFPFDSYYISLRLSIQDESRQMERFWQLAKHYGYEWNGYVLEGHLQQILEAECPQVLGEDRLFLMPLVTSVSLVCSLEQDWEEAISALKRVFKNEALLEKYIKEADRRRIDSQGYGTKVMVYQETHRYYSREAGDYVTLAPGDVYTIQKYCQTNSATRYYFQEIPGEDFNSVGFLEAESIPYHREHWEKTLNEDTLSEGSLTDEGNFIRVQRTITAEEKEKAAFWLAKLAHFEREIALARGKETS